MTNKIYAAILLSTVSIGSNAWAQAAGDQTASADASASVDDIIVTAQKRSERLRDVPVSITAASGEQLLKQGITGPNDLEKIVPGFTYVKSTYGAPIFTIRGIGLYDTFVGVSPTVTVYTDQVPLPYLAMTQGAGLDIERLEVLKGPQGTLFGQNSTGGAINYIAAKPTDEFKAGFDLTYGRFNQIDTQGFLSGPITDTLRARVAVRREYMDGWQRSETRPNDTLGARDFTAARLLLDWDPTDKLKFELNLNGWKDKSETQAPQFVAFSPSRPFDQGGFTDSFDVIGDRAPAPNKARVADWDRDADYQRDDWLKQISLRGDYEILDNMTLTSITAYSDFRQYAQTEVDGTDFNNVNILQVARVKSFSQEVRLAGDLGDRIKYTLGANYQDDKVNGADIGLNYVSSQNGVGPFRYNSFAKRGNQKIKTKAVFGSIDFKLLEGLTLQGAARYTDQKRRFSGCLADGGDGLLALGIQFAGQIAGGSTNLGAPGGCVTLDDSTPALLTPETVRRDLDETNTSWRAGLNWKANPDTLLYANVTKGFKSGTFTLIPAIYASQFTPVTQEGVLAYEVGVKTGFFGNAVQVTAAGFYYDYTDKQIIGVKGFPIFGNLAALNNIPESRVVGAELEATIRPFEGLRLSGGGTYVNSKVKGSFITPDQFGVEVDIGGDAFPNTPKWQFAGDAQYDFPLSSSLEGFVGGSLTARSSTYSRVGKNADYLIKSYALVDLRAGVATPDGKWRAMLWGKNVFNKFYLANMSHQMDTVSRNTGMPATYGITVGYRY
ncbi:TonB-dependent receptor [Sphingopyxis granuli]|uniref:TonB-dependent receptor n=1 Tax=Sphingopyxis granuli TaxID=267128 RepID=UPI001BAF90E9|nr:TonB-dependent receptor [Sphingopyxis granuli]QUM74399.1 TonB-dependent receptor [Sphingopyxis granuli]